MFNGYYTSIVKLDYDIKYTRKNLNALRKWIWSRCLSLRHIKGIKCRAIICRKSQSGNVHVYIHLNKPIPLQDAILLELFFASDPYRAYFNYIRYLNGFDLRILFHRKQWSKVKQNEHVKWRSNWIVEAWRDIDENLFNFHVKCMREFIDFMKREGVQLW